VAGGFVERSHVSRLDPEVGGYIAALQALTDDVPLQEILLEEELTAAPATG